MSAEPAGLLATIPAWIRYGVIAGVLAFAYTLGANIAVTWFKPADLCRVGPLVVPLLSLSALGIFLLLAASAGFATGRTVGSGPGAPLAGLLVGVLGGCALLALIPFMPSVFQRLHELSSLCPDTGSFSAGGSFSFSFGGTAPPGVGLPTPAPGFFSTPPPQAFAEPSTGPAAALDALPTIVIGIGLATGAAALGGFLGVATRADARSG